MFTIKCQRHHHNRPNGTFDEGANQIWDTFETPHYTATLFDGQVLVEFPDVMPDGLHVYDQGTPLHPVNVYRQIIVENAAGKTTEHYRAWTLKARSPDGREATPGSPTSDSKAAAPSA